MLECILNKYTTKDRVLEEAAKHGDLRSMKRIKILCSTITKHVIEMQNVNFDV